MPSRSEVLNRPVGKMAASRPVRSAATDEAPQLAPLPLAIVCVADAVVRDLLSEIAEQCLRDTAVMVPCDPSVRPLLEGAAGTLPGDGSRISSALHKMLSDEVAQTARCKKRAREALAPSLAAGAGADIFGNRPSKSSAETIVCTNCQMPLAANRFAPHLERCLLGRGRQRRQVAPSNGATGN